jgi:hypothetical protein
MPAAEGAVEWAIEVNGTTPALWSPQAIAAELVVTNPLGVDVRAEESWSLWAPWGTPGCSTTAQGCDACGLHSPLESVPVACFGAGVVSHTYGSDVSVPLVAAVNVDGDVSVTLSVAPTENLISLAPPVVRAGSDGSDGNATAGVLLGVSFGSGYRVSSTAVPLRLAMHITGGAGCTRDVIGRRVTPPPCPHFTTPGHHPWIMSHTTLIARTTSLIPQLFNCCTRIAF